MAGEASLGGSGSGELDSRRELAPSLGGRDGSANGGGASKPGNCAVRYGRGARSGAGAGGDGDMKRDMAERAAVDDDEQSQAVSKPEQTSDLHSTWR